MFEYFKKSVLIASIALTLNGCAATQSIEPHPKGYETYVVQGDDFKHTSFTDINGKPVTLNDKKKLVILFATWCSDSKRTLRELKASPLITNQDIQIIGIGREENPESMAKFNQEFELPFALVADPERAIYQHYANKGIPRLILLDEQNKVVKTLIGEQANVIEKVIW